MPWVNTTTAILVFMLAGFVQGIVFHYFQNANLSPSYLLALVSGTWLALSFIVAQFGIGSACMQMRLFRSNDASALRKPIVAVAVGTYATVLLLWLFALTGPLHLWKILLTIAVISSVAGYGFVCEGGRKMFAFTDADQAAKAPLLLKLSALAWLIYLFLPQILRASFPVSDWDSVMYHLPLAQKFMSGGVLHIEPYSQHLNFPGAMSLIHAVFLSLSAEPSIQIICLIYSLFLLVACYIFTKEFWGEEAGVWAVLTLSVLSMLWMLSHTARIDMIMAYFYIIAVFGLWVWLRTPRATAGLVICGVGLAMTLGLKFTAAALVVCTGLVFLLTVWKMWRQGQVVSIRQVALLVMIILPSTFWYLRNWHGLGDPMYPMLRGEVLYQDNSGNLQPLEPALTPLLARELVSLGDMSKYLRQFPALSAMYLNLERTMPRNMLRIWELFLTPEAYSRDRFQTLNIAILLCLLVPFARRKHATLLLLLALASHLAIASKGHMARYLSPAFAIEAVCAGVFLAWLVTHKRFNTTVRAALRICFFFYFAYWIHSTTANSWYFATRVPPWRLFTGEVQPNKFRLRQGPDFSPIDRLNRMKENGELRPSANVLIFGEPRNYVLQTQYLSEHHTFERHRWLAELVNADMDYDAIHRSLADQDVEYVLVDFRMIAWNFVHRPLTERRIESYIWSFYHLLHFLDQRATLVRSFSESSIYRISK